MTVWLAYPWIQRVTYFPILKVSLIGNLQYTEQDAIKEALDKPLDKNNLLLINLKSVQQALLKLPWIKSVYVKRKWPDTIYIELQEKMPLAKWNDANVVTIDGDIFYLQAKQKQKLELSNKLPEFYGSFSEIAKIIDTYNILMESLKPVELTIKRLEIMPDRGWKAMLNNGVSIIIGQQKLQERIKNFLWAYKKMLINNISNIEYVDLRYTNGISVGWKSS